MCGTHFAVAWSPASNGCLFAGSARIEFDLNGQNAQAYFPDQWTGSDEPSVPTLNIMEHGSEDMTLLSQAPSDAVYVCLEP